jgi:hypothetical protein
MKKYKATFYYDGSIEEIEVTKETEHFFFYVLRNYERREKKVTDRSVLFDTWEQAHDWLMKKAKDRVDSAERDHRYQEDKLVKIQAMKNNTVN